MQIFDRVKYRYIETTLNEILNTIFHSVSNNYSVFKGVCSCVLFYQLNRIVKHRHKQVMNYRLVLLLATVMMATVNSCQFGNEAIQAAYDRFELFRKTKTVDPIDPTIQLTQYSYYETDGIKRLA